MRNIPTLSRTAIFLSALLWLPPVLRAAEPTVTLQAVSESGARQTIEAARQAADKLGSPCAIAVVDASGTLVSFDKMDGVRAGSPDLAIGKARTSALLQRPTEQIEDNTDNGRVAFNTAGLVTLRGGVPLVADGQTVGAVGVASLNKDHDVIIATAAAKSFADGLPKR